MNTSAGSASCTLAFRLSMSRCTASVSRRAIGPLQAGTFMERSSGAPLTVVGVSSGNSIPSTLVSGRPVPSKPVSRSLT